MAKLSPEWRRGLSKASRARRQPVELPADYDSLTQAQRAEARQLYVEEQGGLCSHCKHDLDGPPPLEIEAMPINWALFPGARSFLKHPVHLHHDHDTGLTIGAVHALCNAVLWQYHGE